MREDAQAVQIPIWVDLLAVFSAGIAASLLATRKDFDFVGFLMLTIVCALGGGIIRDTLIQQGTPAALQNSSYLIVSFAAAGVGFLSARQTADFDWVVNGVDAISLGLYTLVGVLKGFAAGLPFPSVLLIGVLSTTGGGILRDIMLAKTPEVLLPGAPYATLSLIGGAIAVILHELGVSHAWLWWLPVAVVVALRFTSLRLGWQTPLATDVESRVHRLGTRRIRSAVGRLRVRRVGRRSGPSGKTTTKH